MRIKVLQIGKTKDNYLREGEAEFLKRLSAFCKVEVLTLKDEEKCLAHVKEEDYLVVMDEIGEMKSSKEFAGFLKEFKDYGKTVVFMIGGPHGVSDEARKKANTLLSFSKMTFTHQMVRLFLLEQVYRAMCILTGKDYHY